MLARNAEYIQGSEGHAISVERFRVIQHRFNKTMWRIGILAALLALFFLFGVGMQAVQSDRCYELMQEKQQVQRLQQENDNLRIDIAKLESPERIYTMATQQLGMVVPAHVLYAQSQHQHAATKSR